MPLDISARKFDLPSVSYGPFRFLEAVPWLMLAAALRIFAAGRAPGIQVAATIVVSFAIFLAFLLAAPHDRIRRRPHQSGRFEFC